ncbi:MAG: redoxin domain-containing protein [Burkholderiales bacterium]|nr:redoxin domain-containing protein [Phycisphaerae bacterium]
MLKRLFLILTLLLPASAIAEEPALPRPKAVMIERLREKVLQLDLTAEQRTQVDGLMNDASARVATMRAESKGNLEAFRDKAATVARETREKLQGILTPQQMRLLREAGPEQPVTEPEKPAKAQPAEKPREMSMDGDPMRPASTETTPTETAAATPVEEKMLVGVAAPDFRLKRIDGKLVTLQSLKGRPTVLVFGSFSSPTFREHVTKFDDLRKDYRTKANVVVIYTREAYPANEWEVDRNVDSQVKVTQPASIEERNKLAMQTRDAAKLNMDILVDDMDDAVSIAYGALPNGCVVIDAEGVVIAKQKWADVWGVRSHLDTALRQR